MSKLIDTHLDGANELVWTRDDVEVARLSSGNVFTFPPGALGGYLSFAPAPSGDVTGATDTAALQTAINAAIAAGHSLALTYTGTPYYINSTLTIQPSSGTEAEFSLYGPTGQTSIQWVGGSTTSVFLAYGWKRSVVDSIHVQIDGTSSGVTVWDLDIKTGATSTGQLSFRNCQVLMNAQASNVGWRLGHGGHGVAGSELSFINWTRCLVKDTSVTSGTIGWVNEHTNSLNHVWVDCTGYFLTNFVTTISTSGAGDANGGDTLFFYGCGTSGGANDYTFSTAGSYAIFGGRYENGKKFLVITNGSTFMDVAVYGVKLAAYTPSDNIVIDLANTTFSGGRPFNVLFDGFVSYGQLQTAAFLKATAATTRPSLVTFRGGAIYGADPFYTISGAVDVRVERVQHIANTSLQPDVPFDPQSAPSIAYRAVATTYTAILPDAFITADATSAAFTVTLPTAVGVKGKTFTIKRLNSGANAVTVGTTSSQTVDGSTTFSLSAQYATVTVVSDGANWQIQSKV